MSSTLESTVAALTSFDDSVKRMEEAIRPLLTAVETAKEDDTLPALTKARIHATLAYAVNALYYIYLRAHNVSTTHLDDELHRVQSLFARLRAVERKHREQNGDDSQQGVIEIGKVLDKLDAYLTPEEAALVHACTGALQPRQRHKRFPDSDSADNSDGKKAKKQKIRKENGEENADDVQMEDVVESVDGAKAKKAGKKKKKKDKKKRSAEGAKETLSTKIEATDATPSTNIEPTNVAASSTTTTSTGKKKKKSKKSKKKSDAVTSDA